VNAEGEGRPWVGVGGPVPLGVFVPEPDASEGELDGKGRAVVGVGPGSLNCGRMRGGK
jgi:hypothetical protein